MTTTTTTTLARAPSYDLPPQLGRAPTYDLGAPLPSYSPPVDPPPAYSRDDLPPPPRAPAAPRSLLAQAALARQPPPREPSPRTPAPSSTLLAQAALSRQAPPRARSVDLTPPETTLLAQAARARCPHIVQTPRYGIAAHIAPAATCLLGNNALTLTSTGSSPRGSPRVSPRVSLVGTTSVLAAAAEYHQPGRSRASSSPASSSGSLAPSSSAPMPASVLGAAAAYASRNAVPVAVSSALVYNLSGEVGGRWSLVGASGVEGYQFIAQTVNGKLRMVTSTTPRGQDVVAEVEGGWMHIFEDRVKGDTMGTMVRGRPLRWVWVHKGLLVMEGEDVVGRWGYAKRWKKRLDGGTLEVYERGAGGRDIVALVLSVVARRVLGKE